MTTAANHACVLPLKVNCLIVLGLNMSLIFLNLLWGRNDACSYRLVLEQKVQIDPEFVIVLFIKVTQKASL